MERFQVHKIASGDTQDLMTIFGSLLKTKGMKNGSPRYTPLENTITHISALQAKTVLIQNDVQDPDFLAEHRAYYSKWSYEVSRFCYRLHFFNEEAVSDNALDVVDQMAMQENSYLGFVTLRPISVSPQAATILKAVNCENKCFILSKDNFTVNIAGQSFVISGTPFMQQDNAVGACAQASIWMALRTLRRREGASAFSPAQITNAATRFYVKGRTLPNRGGLAVEQITEAIRASGYSPHVIPLRDLHKEADVESLKNARQALYPYIESGIPVLLILFPKNGEGHAVLLIGHGWNDNPPEKIKNGSINLKESDENIEIIDASSWVTPFYIHNDNTGPYLQLPDEDKGGYSLGDAVFAIPFLQLDVFVDAAEAKLTCLQLLADTLEGSIFDAGSPELVTRTYLQDRSEFRASVIASDMPDDVKAYYRSKWLPRRVWVTGINLSDEYEKSPDKNSVRIGEILLDPSSEPEDGCFLSIHLGEDLLPQEDDGIGVVIDRDAFNGEIEAFQVTGNRYAPLVRNK